MPWFDIVVLSILLASAGVGFYQGAAREMVAVLSFLIAAIVVIEFAWWLDRKGVDDPVGAVAVHGIGGTLGVLFVGVFANGKYGAAWNLSDSSGVKGILYGDAGQLGAQALGAVVIWTVIFGIAFAFFKIQNKFTKDGGIRLSEEIEIEGADLPEMGVMAYND